MRLTPAELIRINVDQELRREDEQNGSSCIERIDRTVPERESRCDIGFETSSSHISPLV